MYVSMILHMNHFLSTSTDHNKDLCLFCTCATSIESMERQVYFVLNNTLSNFII